MPGLLGWWKPDTLFGLPAILSLRMPRQRLQIEVQGQNAISLSATPMCGLPTEYYRFGWHALSMVCVLSLSLSSCFELINLKAAFARTPSARTAFYGIKQNF